MIDILNKLSSDKTIVTSSIILILYVVVIAILEILGVECGVVRDIYHYLLQPAWFLSFGYRIFSYYKHR